MITMLANGKLAVVLTLQCPDCVPLISEHPSPRTLALGTLLSSLILFSVLRVLLRATLKIKAGCPEAHFMTQLQAVHIRELVIRSCLQLLLAFRPKEQLICSVACMLQHH